MLFQRRKKSICTLQQLIKGIIRDVNAAEDLSENHYLKFFSNYFTYNKEEDLYIPKMMRIKMDENYILPVPVITLVDVKEHGIDYGDAEFSVDANGFINPVDDEKNDDQVPQISVEVCPGKHSEKMRVKLNFKQIQTSEGFMRIQDAFNVLISPIRISEEPNEQQNP